MSHLCNFGGDRYVFFECCWRSTIFTQRSVHHDGTEPADDGGHTGGRRIPMILVHANRDIRIKLYRRLDEVGQDDVVGKGPRAAAGLHDHRAVRCIGGPHDCQHLFHIVDVKCRDGVAMQASVIHQLFQRNESHVLVS
jgi:hypothetical protein